MEEHDATFQNNLSNIELTTPEENDSTISHNEFITTSDSSGSTDCNENKQANKSSCISFASTNARSLAPKIHSAIDFFTETDLTLMVVTETWLQEGRTLEDNVADLDLGAGLGLIHKGRRGKRGGGVGILYKKSKISLKKLTLHQNNYEIVAACGKIKKKQFQKGRCNGNIRTSKHSGSKMG